MRIWWPPMLRSPVGAAEHNEFTALVAACMKHPRRSLQREVLELRAVINRSYHEIAKELGLKVGTVKSRIARARTSLRKIIATSWPDLENNASTGDWFELFSKN